LTRSCERFKPESTDPLIASILPRQCLHDFPQEGAGDETSHDLDRSATEENVNEDDIKEICDVSSGMASSVMQLFLKQVGAKKRKRFFFGVVRRNISCMLEILRMPASVVLKVLTPRYP